MWGIRVSQVSEVSQNIGGKGRLEGMAVKQANLANYANSQGANCPKTH